MSGARVERDWSIKQPAACSNAELLNLEDLVRCGFSGSDAELPERINAARWLGFHYAVDGSLAGIAALKAPEDSYREHVFREAAAPVRWSAYRLELGWVYVVPHRRGNGIASRLCRMLTSRAPGAGMFATTRPDNTGMIKILNGLGFALIGRPYRHVRRNENLRLLLRRAER